MIDVYAAFRRMLARGNVPDGIDQLPKDGREYDLRGKQLAPAP